ncbi:MAG TPA: GNAT family N-acetyltransferase [Ktedonobacteraceae bacterium]|nr:GNAT family N-acetyltransferase [Ktedonobacteraceae bacterium]
MIVRAARVEDAGGIAKVHVDSWRTTYKGVIPDDFLASLSYESRSQRWRSMLSNPTRFAGDFVAEDKTGRIVGFISGGPAQEPYPVYRGELYAIYILQEYQGQEIGRRLTEALVGKLLEAGIDNMLVWVLAENPARKFYEALGGRLIRTRQIEIGGAILDEVAYGWQDINSILAVRPKDTQ